VYAEVDAGHPRGSWPAESKAAELTATGTPATVVVSADGKFLVVPAAQGGGDR
jgi:hypothetical protein